MKTIILIIFIFLSAVVFGQPKETRIISDPVYVIHFPTRDFVNTGNTTTFRMIYKYAVTTGDSIMYFSESGSGDGLTPETPMKIDSINTISVPSGTILAIERGETSNLAVTLRTGLNYCSYGTGTKPKLSGTTTLTSWTNYSGNIYRASIGSAEPNYLLVDGEPLQITRYPDDEVTWYYNIDAVTNDTVLTISEANGKNYVGSTLVMRAVGWGFETGKITAQSGSDVTIDNASVYALDANDPAYFINNLEDIKQGSWCYTGGYVYVWLPDNSSPATKTIEITTLEDAFYGADVNTIQINNIDIYGFNGSAVDLRGNCDDVLIDNCNMTYNYNFGVDAFRNVAGTSFYDLGMSGISAKNNTVIGSNSGGIFIADSDPTIDRNTVRDIGRIKNIGTGGYVFREDMLVGILARGTGGTIQYNTVDSVGGMGIYTNLTGGIINENKVNYFASSLGDVGGIYTNLHTIGQEVTNNYVGNGAALNPENDANGLYADGHQSGTLFYGNVIENNPRGMLINVLATDSVLTLRKNTFVGNGVGTHWSFYTGGEASLVNYDIDSNLYVVTESTDNAMYFGFEGATVPANFDMDYDTIISLTSKTPVHYGSSYYGLAKLQEEGLETNGYLIEKNFKTYTPTDTLSANLFTPGTFDSNSEGWFENWTASGIDGGSLTFSYSGATINTSQSYNLSYTMQGTGYLMIDFDIISTTGNLMRVVGSSIGSSQFEKFSIGTDLYHYNSITSASGTLTDRYALAISGTAGQAFYLDNISLYEIEKVDIPSSDYYRLYTNSSFSPITVTVPSGTWKTASGTTISGTVELDAWNSLTLIKE